VFWDISTKPKIGIVWKLVHLEASTKPPIHSLIHEFLINMVFTNFKKGLKMAFGPLGVNIFSKNENKEFLCIHLFVKSSINSLK
jgi:hypothetical protein